MNKGDVSSLLKTIGTFDATKEKADDLKKVKGYWTKNGENLKPNRHLYICPSQPNDGKGI